MKKILLLLLTASALLYFSCNTKKRNGNPRVLVFTKTIGLPSFIYSQWDCRHNKTGTGKRI